MCVLRGEGCAGVGVNRDCDVVVVVVVGILAVLDDGGDALGDFDAFEERAGFEDVDVEGAAGGWFR